MRVDGRITQRHGLGILPAHVGAREREGRGGRLAQDAPYVPVSDRAGGAGEGRKTTSHEQRPALGAAATDASRLAARLAARDDGDSVAGAEAAAAAAAVVVVVGRLLRGRLLGGGRRELGQRGAVQLTAHRARKAHLQLLHTLLESQHRALAVCPAPSHEENPAHPPIAAPQHGVRRQQRQHARNLPRALQPKARRGPTPTVQHLQLGKTLSGAWLRAGRPDPISPLSEGSVFPHSLQLHQAGLFVSEHLPNVALGPREPPPGREVQHGDQLLQMCASLGRVEASGQGGTGACLVLEGRCVCRVQSLVPHLADLLARALQSGNASKFVPSTEALVQLIQSIAFRCEPGSQLDGGPQPLRVAPAQQSRLLGVLVIALEAAHILRQRPTEKAVNDRETVDEVPHLVAKLELVSVHQPPPFFVLPLQSELHGHGTPLPHHRASLHGLRRAA
mmetsp:Transcript_28554/g.82010  ORF Transcript_28554/g.82010 Transcript_28554/m.82010 type:complete len:448 (+) Transcript_28554:579-1922(+)